MDDYEALESREQTDHWFGSPLEEGSAHPDAIEDDRPFYSREQWYVVDMAADGKVVRGPYTHFDTARSIKDTIVRNGYLLTNPGADLLVQSREPEQVGSLVEGARMIRARSKP